MSLCCGVTSFSSGAEIHANVLRAGLEPSPQICCHFPNLLSGGWREYCTFCSSNVPFIASLTALAWSCAHSRRSKAGCFGNSVQKRICNTKSLRQRALAAALGSDSVPDDEGMSKVEASTKDEEPVGAQPSASMETGIRYWRRGPAEEPEYVKGIAGTVEDDYEHGVLERTLPILSVAVLSMAPSILPYIGTECHVRLSVDDGDAGRIAAIQYAVKHDGGVIGCFADIEVAIGLPWGGTAAEILSLIRIGEGEVLVHLRAVAGVRLVARTPARESQGFKIALVQEVPEWGGKDDLAVAYGRYGARISTGRLNIRKSAGGGLQASLEQEDVPEWDSEGGTTVPERLEKEIEYLKMLFSKCGALQRNNRMMTGCDFFSKTFQERTKEVAQTLQDVPLLALGHATDNFGQQLREAIVASHAAVAAFSVHMRTQFVCEPTSIFPRLKRIKEFLLKAHNLLSARSVCREIESERDGNN